MSNIRLTYEERIKINEMLEKNMKKTEIANELGCKYHTVYAEIKRGINDEIYDPEYSQMIVDMGNKNKGRKPILLLDVELAEYISNLILHERMSPERIIEVIKNDKRFENVPMSPNTIYRAIDKGEIPGVSRENLMNNMVKMFSGGHIIIPKRIREEYGYQDGNEFKISSMNDGRIILEKYSGLT